MTSGNRDDHGLSNDHRIQCDKMSINGNLKYNIKLVWAGWCCLPGYLCGGFSFFASVFEDFFFFQFLCDTWDTDGI